MMLRLTRFYQRSPYWRERTYSYMSITSMYILLFFPV